MASFLTTLSNKSQKWNLYMKFELHDIACDGEKWTPEIRESLENGRITNKWILKDVIATSWDVLRRLDQLEPHFNAWITFVSIQK